MKSLFSWCAFHCARAAFTFIRKFEKMDFFGSICSRRGRFGCCSRAVWQRKPRRQSALQRSPARCSQHTPRKLHRASTPPNGRPWSCTSGRMAPRAVRAHGACLNALYLIRMSAGDKGWVIAGCARGRAASFPLDVLPFASECTSAPCCALRRSG